MSRPGRPQRSRRRQRQREREPVRTRSCGKTRFRDAAAAKLALARIERQDDSDHRPRRAYPCPGCRGWHLTSSTTRRGD